MSNDQELNDLLKSFMSRLRRYLDAGGPEDVIDRILAAGTVAAAAFMILWSPNRKTPGVMGVVVAVGRQLWHRRMWLGIPVPPPETAPKR